MVFRIEFEKQECTRCGGTGEHSFTPRYGSRCFKCQGTTQQLSPAGSRALKAYEALIEERCTKNASEVKAGELVFQTADGALFKKSGWYEVTESTPDPLNEGRWTIRFTPTAHGGRACGVFHDSKVRFQDIDAMKEIIREVVKRFKGATLIES